MWGEAPHIFILDPGAWGEAPHIFTLDPGGAGRSPIYNSPSVGVWGEAPHIPYAVFSVILVVLQVRAQKRKRFLFAFFGEHSKQHFKKIRRFAVDNANAL